MGEMKFSINKKSPSTDLLLLTEYAKGKLPIEIKQGDSSSITVDNNVSFNTPLAILRFLARTVESLGLYGKSSLERTEVDHWLSFSSHHLACPGEFCDALLYMDHVLGPITFLVGHSLTIADVAVWSALQDKPEFHKLLVQKKVPANVERYFNFLAAKPEFRNVSKMTRNQSPSCEQATEQTVRKERKEEGKFVELLGAEMGKVVVRFPPEASGYLHVGHAKAALLNQYYQQTFNGKLIMRFDDTNPAKENAEFEKVILDDVKMLGIVPDMFTYTSDHFDLLMDLCAKMICIGKAYADDTEPEVMKKEREERIESRNRNNSVEKNLQMWEEMKKGTIWGQKCCIRAKIDMKSDNGCLRDPTMYRCKLETHVRTGDKYKAYPTYDFACPIVDSVEHVTHALRTMEYHDRDDQYYWFLEALGLCKPYLWEYSRLNLQNTVMSKRKLTWFVDQGLVEGWDDPRFPTVRGVMRRGMTVNGMKEFVIAQGSSRSINMMDWDKIWAFNKKVIDPVAPRYTALLEDSVVPVFVQGATEEVKDVQKHPKDPSVGFKPVWYSAKVLVEGADAEELHIGENVTFINWGNLLIKDIKRSPKGNVISIEADLNLENKDYKKTQKITWLAVTDRAPFVPAVCVTFDHIITKAVLGKDDDFKQYINKNSKTETVMLGDPELAAVKKGDIIQLQRRGYFICDSSYDPASRYSGRESPCVLFNIPDGHVKEMPTAGSKHKPSGKEELKTDRRTPTSVAEKPREKETSCAVDATSMHKQIMELGNKIRQMKTDKVAKIEIEKEVKALLRLKEDYCSATGLEWKPDKLTPATLAQKSPNHEDFPSAGRDSTSTQQQVTKQGNKVKPEKPAKSKGDVHVTSRQPNLEASSSVVSKEIQSTKDVPEVDSNSPVIQLKEKIDAQANKVRELKTSGAQRAEIDAEVNVLLRLKAEYKELTGEDPISSGGVATKKESTEKHLKKKDGNVTDEKKQKKGNKESDAEKRETVKSPDLLQAKHQSGERGKDRDDEQKKLPTEAVSTNSNLSRELKKVTRLGLEIKKEENFSEWYSQVITKSEMIEYYDVSGCYVLRQWAFGIWERIAEWFDEEIKKLGFQNCYFPMFVSHSALETEKEHIEDFAPEVAWVTRSGQTDLAEPIAIRPTSETVMYPSYAKWVQSHRDLPIKLNQWCNVVRWEFKHPQPFLRTREFLWQEGHSAYATYEEAEKEVYQIIDLYENIYENLLAIPVIKGKKTQKEKFAGGEYTTTVEAYIACSGRGIQAATSHHLGQNFSKMFNISFEDPDTRERCFAYQNSWAITTRSIGIIVMIHGDNKGLVLPPRIAPVQVVLVPCGLTVQLGEEEKTLLIDKCVSLAQSLKDNGIRVREDYRDNYSPGWKFNHWELKGIPVRIELGPRDVQQQQFVAVRRDTGNKLTVKFEEAASSIKNLLEEIHNSMFAKAKKEIECNTALCTDFDELCSHLEKNKIILAPFCGDVLCEEKIKKLSARDAVTEEGAPTMGAKGLCIPFEQPASMKEIDKCIGPECTNIPKMYTLFGKSY